MSRTARQLTVVVVIMVAVLGLSTGIASAHATVVTSNPGDGQSVLSSPAEISVTFSENISAISGGLTVLNADGKPVALESAQVVNGRTLTSAPTSPLENGTYVVTYRVLSADGHPVSGSILFGVGSGALDRSVQPSTSDDQTWELIGGLSRFLVALAALIAAGVAFFLAFIHDQGADRWRIVPFVRIGSIVALFGAIGVLMSQAALLTGKGAGAVTDTNVLRDVLSENLGWSLAVLMLGLAAVHLSTDFTVAKVSRGFALVGGLAVTVSFAVWGHASELAPRALSLFADFIHATSAALWLGGIVGLVMVLTLRSADAVESTAIILRRFSLVALISVIALVVAGLTLTLTGSGEHLGSLLTTTWGRLVVAKMALTSIVIVLAAWNRRSLVPAIVEPTTDPALRADRWRTLLRTVRLEALVIVVVIGFTAVLVSVPPARTAVTTDSSPVSISKRVDTGDVALSVTPALVGPNQIEIVFTDGTGQPVTVANTMTIEFSQPAAGLEPITRQVSAASPGLFVYEGNELSIPGDWTITVAIRTGDFSEQRTTFEVPVRR